MTDIRIELPVRPTPNPPRVRWLLERNMGWNLVGLVLPLVVAVIAIPILVHGLGVVSYGLLVLAWAFLGYSSIFDLGLGRALTQLIASMSGEERPAEQEAELFWTSLLLMAAVGVTGTAAVVAVAPFVVGQVLHIQGGLQRDAVIAGYALAAAIPLVTISTGLRGVLEAHQRFREANLVRLPLGALTFLAPLAALPISRGSVIAPVASLVLVRFGAAVAYLVVCLKVRSTMGRHIRIGLRYMMPLVRFGGWITVSNLLAPLMSYLDRFVVGFAVSVAALAYYSTPAEVMQRVSVVAFAISGVLFPMFASTLAGNRARTVDLYRRGIDYTFIAVFPIALSAVALSHEALSMWLGSPFANESSVVLAWFAVGVLVNSLAQIPYALVQGAGRADLTAKIHMFEVVPYLAALGILVFSRGIEGAAIAWALRVTLDLALLLIVAKSLVPEARGVPVRTVGLLIAGAVVCWAATLLGSTQLKVGLIILVVAAMATFGLRGRLGTLFGLRFERTPGDPQ